MELIVPTALFVISGLATVGLVGALIPWLKRWAILDIPNQRSSHEMPVPRGAGLGVVLIVFAVWAALSVDLFGVSGGDIRSAGLWIILIAVGLAAISWVDDIRGLSPLLRLVPQFIAVYAVLFLVPLNGPVFGGWLPPQIDLVLTGILWVWFINLFNFMDGIDGITGLETSAVGLGTALVLGVAGGDPLLGQFGITIAAAGLGFLWWNWHPAKIFLGDVGSIPLGFLLGWLLLSLAANGYWAPALILPLYYLVDATLTLLRRVVRRERVWEAHREHYYQQAVRKGMSHARVALSIAVANIVLIGLAITSLHAPATALVSAATVVFILLLYFKSPAET